MAEDVLGVPFEVHGGGSDLVFPHHENEIAQTEAARGKPLSRTWMHNGMVQMGDEKMAKSVGNIRLLHARARPVRARRVRDVDGRRPLPEAGRVHGGGARGRGARRGSRRATWCGGWTRGAARGSTATPSAFFDALADDFNTPAARAALFEWVAEANRRIDAGERVGPGRLRRDAARARAGEPAGGATRRRLRSSSGWPPSARRRAPRATSSAPTACATSSPRPGWEIRDTPGGRPARARAVIVYGRNAVREALRGQAPVQRVLRHRAGRARGLAGRRGDGPEDAVADRGALRLAGPPGRLRRGRAYPYADADSLLDAGRRARARARRGPGPAQPGRDLPGGRERGLHGRGAARAALGRGHARGLQARRPARSSTCRSRACATSPTGSARRRSARRGSTAPRPTRACRYDRPDYSGRVVLVLGREGRGLRPRVAEACDELIRCRSAGRSARSTSRPRPPRWCTESCNSRADP